MATNVEVLPKIVSSVHKPLRHCPNGMQPLQIYLITQNEYKNIEILKQNTERTDLKEIISKLNFFREKFGHILAIGESRYVVGSFRLGFLVLGTLWKTK